MNSLTKHIIQFLKANKIPAAKEWLQKTIESHPDFPSLLCISESLGIAGIDCITHRVEIASINTVTLPALFHLQNDDAVPVSKSSQLTGKIAAEASGVIINICAVNLTDEYQEELRKQTKTDRFLVSVCCLSLLLFGWLSAQKSHWQNAWLITSSITGIYLCYEVFRKENGQASMWVNTACQAMGNGCDKVLNSLSSRGFWGIRIYDIAFVYFFTLLFYSAYEDNLVLAYYIILPTLPIIIISVLYQKIKLKAWCILCLLIGMVCLLQLILVGLTKNAFQGPSTFKDIVHFLSYAMLGLVWFLFKKQHYLKTQNAEIAIANLSLRRDPQVFLSLLKHQKAIHSSPKNEAMVFGNPDAPLQLLMVCQPYCKPCSVAHHKIDRLIALYGDSICLKIIWFAIGQRSIDAVNLIYAVTNSQPKQDRLRKIESWFSVMNFEAYAKENETGLIKTDDQNRLSEQKEWATANSINVTPTIFINNHQMPSQYAVDDLQVMAPNLIELFETENIVCANRGLIAPYPMVK